MGQNPQTDRLDALVWALTELLLEADAPLSVEEALELMTPAERQAFFEAQAAAMAKLWLV